MLVWATVTTGREQHLEAMEKFCKKIGKRDDTWYATSIELVDYVAAARNVQVSADGALFRNTSAVPLWIAVNGKSAN